MVCSFENYEFNFVFNFEISDFINVKKGLVLCEVVVVIVNYINYCNFNIVMLVLNLLDICVKNCGYFFYL